MTLEEKIKKIDELKLFFIENPLPFETEKSLEEDFKLRFTYDSNAIEGNTLTLLETKVVLEGITIGGKTLKEHFEAINHQEAILFIENIIKKNESLSEYIIKSIHSLILKNIDDNNAGKYRNVNVAISGANHKPPYFFDVPNKMQEFINWYENNDLHSIIKVSRAHIYFVGIHPFIDGNGRTSRLLMNLELLKNNYPAINIKNESKFEYYEALDLAHCKNDFSKFDNLIVDNILIRFNEKKEQIKNSIKRRKN